MPDNGICPWCEGERTPDTDECGGEGEGACGVYLALIDALEHHDDLERLGVRAWLRNRVDGGELSSDAAPIAEQEIRARFGAIVDLDGPGDPPGFRDLPETEGGCDDCGGLRCDCDDDEGAIRVALAEAGLPFRPCGLNANWSVRAWHLGPSATPNVNDGDLYLLNREDARGTFAVVRYDPSKDEDPTLDDAKIVTLLDDVTLDDVRRFRFVMVNP